MKRIVIWLASTVSVLVLLFGYHTSTNSSASTATSAESSSTSSSSNGSTVGSAAPPDPTTGSSGSGSSGGTSSGGTSSAAAKTYQGSTAQTRWGPVQVQITVKSGTITAVDVLQQPTENHKDEEINSYALPILVQDTLSAQSAKIDMVSGATVTSDGYVESLQSALDKAGL